MASIEVHGTETTVKIIETEVDGEVVYGLSCDKGAWCPRFGELAEVQTLNLTDAIAAAEVHADCVMHA